ncbi:MAG: HAD family hydrolase [Candidatus Hodarchaeales archaeon]
MKPQNQLTNIDTIIFDFDGTLFKGETFSLPIFQNCLSILIDEFHYNLEFPTNEKILSQFGKHSNEIYKTLLESVEPSVINSFADCIENAEVKTLENGGGELYEGVPEVLKELKTRGYKLALCTNARADYYGAVVKRFQLHDYFSTMYAAGQYGWKDKNWMVSQIIKKLEAKNFAVVGDRHHDIEAAKANKGLSVGCAYGYGFGEVKKADFVINDFRELLALLS